MEYCAGRLSRAISCTPKKRIWPRWMVKAFLLTLCCFSRSPGSAPWKTRSSVEEARAPWRHATIICRSIRKDGSIRTASGGLGTVCRSSHRMALARVRTSRVIALVGRVRSANDTANSGICRAAALDLKRHLSIINENHRYGADKLLVGFRIAGIAGHESRRAGLCRACRSAGVSKASEYRMRRRWRLPLRQGLYTNGTLPN